MKKIIKSRIFLVIITTIIVASASVYAATTYKASDVVYNASDGTSMNVNDALNELYNKINKKGYNYFYKNGTAIYYNPVSGEICEDYVEDNSKNENKVGCMKWYIFNDSSDSSTVNMILDHNTTAIIAWNNDNKNVSYEESNLKVEVDKLVSVSNWKNIPRLITDKEIASITENEKYIHQVSGFYLDSNSETQTASGKGTSRYAWLFDYTNSCTSYGCNVSESIATYGYWTSTPFVRSNNTVMRIDYHGTLSDSEVKYNTLGIRPVITIPKSKLS